MHKNLIQLDVGNLKINSNLEFTFCTPFEESQKKNSFFLEIYILGETLVVLELYQLHIGINKKVVLQWPLHDVESLKNLYC
jgi:hypothetical protein